MFSSWLEVFCQGSHEAQPTLHLVSVFPISLHLLSLMAQSFNSTAVASLKDSWAVYQSDWGCYMTKKIPCQDTENLDEATQVYTAVSDNAHTGLEGRIQAEITQDAEIFCI